MKILFLIFFSLTLFAQEEPTEDKVDECSQELEKKCPDKDGVYNCIIEDPTNEKKKFSKDCFPKFMEGLESGKYSNPCFDELKKACPNSDEKCIKLKKASLAPDCQELLNDKGIPQAPKPDELNKAVKACEPESYTTCEPSMLEYQFAFDEEKTKEADKKLKEHIKCMKKVYKNPKDENCQKALKEYREELQKDAPNKGKGYQEIK